MSEEVKTFNFDTGSNGLLAAILPALQNRGIDTGMLMGMMNNRGNGFFGGNGGFQDIIALIVIAAIFGNGNGGGIFGGGNNNANRELLADMVQRNGVDLSQLASTLNCSVGKIDAAIGQVATQICNLAGQQGMGFQQVINAIQAGNCNLAGQIANCCCDLKGVINNVAVGQERGFSSLAFETQKQTCDLKQAVSDNTASILAKLDAIEDSRKDRELAEKDRVIATLTARSERQAELQPIYSALSDLKCNQVPVKKIACPEQYIPVNTGINANYGLIPNNYCYGFNPFAGGGFCGGNSLWG